MDYSYDQFNALVLEAERQGGARLNDKCVGEMVPFTIADKPAPAMTCHCGNDSIFAVPYEGGDRPDKPGKEKAGLLRACAVCDSLGTLPRFIDAIPDIDLGVEDEDD